MGAVRQAAVELLGQIVEKGDQYAVAAVTTHLQHRDSRVRQAAVEALGNVAGKNDHETTRSVASRLIDENPDVRKAAVMAISQVTIAADQNAISGLTVCSQDKSSSLRQ